MSNQTLKLSVVMATYNRAGTLGETLSHLADQDLSPDCYEVIISDDCSTDDTRRVVEEAAKKVPFALTYRHHAPNRGPGYTQNRGIEGARAPVVLLMADDIFMSRHALTAHLKVHQAHPGREVAVLGRVVQSPKLDQSVFIKTWDPFRFSEFEGLTEVPYYRFWACNISVKREMLTSCDGFLEHRGRGGAAAHEDPELGYRLHKKGLRILHAPDALGHHYHVVSFETACKRKYETGLNFGEFQANVPEPEIAVSYHVLNRHTLGDHLRAWSSPRRQYLSASDRSPAKVLARQLLRVAAFNGLTIPWLWEPAVRRAEQDKTLAGWINRDVYRGILFYYFLKGCRDGNRLYGHPDRLTASAAQP
jgi:glycosyltransferase involved in cell wall biosynthesis